MARRRCVYWSNTQRIRIRLRGVIIQTCDTYGGHEKKPRAPLRQADVTAASSTCGAMPRALRRPLNAPLRMSTRMCGAGAVSYHPTRPTREPRRAPWPLQSSAGCRSNPPGRGDLTGTQFTLHHGPHDGRPGFLVLTGPCKFCTEWAGLRLISPTRHLRLPKGRPILFGFWCWWALSNLERRGRVCV